VSDFRAIEDAGVTMLSLLEDRMGRDPGAPESPERPITDAQIALVSPGEVAETTRGNEDPIRLSLFLYRVDPSEGLANQPRTQVDATTVRDPPLALDCYYLLTAYPGEGTQDPSTNRHQQHRVLGRAMQVLRDGAVIREGDLSGTLRSPLHVSPVAQSMREVLDVWNTFEDRPFQPSVAYLVSPVEIDPAADREVDRVLERRTHYRVRDRVAERAGEHGDDDV
jgi:hypothetical protein